jgi:hypothetical protein
VLFDLLNPHTSPEPGTILTPRLHGSDSEQQQLEVLLGPAEFNPPLAAVVATPGPVAASPQQPPTPRPPTDDRLPLPYPHDGVDAAPICSFASAPTRQPVPITPAAEDHICTPGDFLVGAAERFEANIAAIALLKNLEEEGRSATSEDQTVLARFSGFGDAAFEPAFRLSAHRAEERIWVERGQRLRSLVTDTEWESFERSRLNAFFTSPDVVEAIWNGLLTLGLGDITNPRILEPAAGSAASWDSSPRARPFARAGPRSSSTRLRRASSRRSTREQPFTTSDFRTRRSATSPSTSRSRTCPSATSRSWIAPSSNRASAT